MNAVRWIAGRISWSAPRGGLRDHIERGSLDLGGTARGGSLDEADENARPGVSARTSNSFSARRPRIAGPCCSRPTVPPMIATLAQQFQRDARRINTVTGTTQHADIAYQALRVAASDSEHAIFNLLRYHHDKGAIVFANTRAAVNHLTARLGQTAASPP